VTSDEQKCRTQKAKGTIATRRLRIAPRSKSVPAQRDKSSILWLVTRHSSLVTYGLVSCLSLLAPHLCARDLPPPIPPPQPMVLPAAVSHVLPNGLRVLVLERPGLPIVTLDLAIKTGSEADPPNLPGTAEFAASLLDEGTRKRTAQQIAATLDEAGGTLDTGAERDDSYATVTMLSNHLRLAFDLLSDVIIHPAFQPAEVERMRKQTLSALDILRQDPEYVADTVIKEEVFQGLPYSHPTHGVVESIRNISPDALKRFHALYYQPSNAFLVAVGDVTPSQAFSMAQKYFGRWRNRQPIPAMKSRRKSPAPARRVVAIEDPNAAQTVIRIANPGIERDSSQYPALMVANQVLGGPAENLLFSALRTRRGLVYGASSDLDCYRLAGIWEEKTSTRAAETLRTVQLILDQMKRLRRRAFGQWELGNAQNYLVGHMALDFESSQDIADHLVELLIYNLPPDDWNQFPGKIRSLTVGDVRSAIRSYLKPQDAVIVLVGNLSGLRQDLKKFGPVQMIPLSRINLASATLGGQPAGP
jgi:zinc protease